MSVTKSRRMLKLIKEINDPRLGVVHPDIYTTRLYQASLVKAIEKRKAIETEHDRTYHMLISLVTSLGGEITMPYDTDSDVWKLEIIYDDNGVTFKTVDK